MVNNKDWGILCEVELESRKHKLNNKLWNDYWNVVERIAVERDMHKHPERVYEMLKEFDYEKNGKELSVQFLITMLGYLNGIDE